MQFYSITFQGRDFEFGVISVTGSEEHSDVVS